MPVNIRVLLAWSVAVLAASGQPLQVSGRVVDGEGLAVKNASLLLETRAASNNIKAKSRPDQAGKFAFPAVEPGLYELVCDAPGFDRLSVPVKGTYGGSVYVGALILRPSSRDTVSRPSSRVPFSPSLRISDASIDTDGRVHLVLANGTRVVVPPEKDQTGCRALATTDDGHAAGWLVEFQTPGVSYSVPFTLVVYRPGAPTRRFGSGMPLYDWHFTSGDKEVEFTWGPLHGPGVLSPRHELWDIETGKKLKEWTEPEDPADFGPHHNQSY